MQQPLYIPGYQVAKGSWRDLKTNRLYNADSSRSNHYSPALRQLKDSLTKDPILLSDATMLQPELIAPCGMNCALCLAYQRPKNKCLGCRDETPKSAKSCESCIIKNCETIRNTPSHFCYDCPSMPCKRLKKLDTRYRTKYAMSMIDNLNEIKEKGMDSFLANQTAKYTCTTCNGLICVHRSRCLSCNP